MRIMPVNCAEGTLAVYSPSSSQPWNKQRVQHLYRRMGFGASLEQINDALSMEPADLVDQIIDQAIAAPLWEEPYWSNYSWMDFDNEGVGSNFDAAINWMTSWFGEMPQQSFREKMVLFWSNHFVTQFEVYELSSMLYDYHKCLMENAFGNFKTFVNHIGVNPAMLIYLSGSENTKESPNENYARELYELFTLGEGNGYTQEDIVETSRALTGYVVQTYLEYNHYFVSALHDENEKTIFGQTGNWGYDDVIDLLFEQRTDEIAQFICGKLYEFFVHPNQDEDIVSGLATTFKENNFELEPVLRQLFKSEHFFDAYNIGTIIKSPIDALISFSNELGLDFDGITFEEEDEDGNLVQFTWKNSFLWAATDMGQYVFSPVDVAGWPGNRNWLNSNTLAQRWQTSVWIIYYVAENQTEAFMQMIKSLCDNSNDPNEITVTIVDHIISGGFQSAEAYETATNVFKGDVPQNYYDSGLWNLDWEFAYYQVAALMVHIIRQPDFAMI